MIAFPFPLPSAELFFLTKISSEGQEESGWIGGALRLSGFRLHTDQREAQCELVGDL